METLKNIASVTLFVAYCGTASYLLCELFGVDDTIFVLFMTTMVLVYGEVAELKRIFRADK